MASNLKTYPSGFLGSASVALTLPQEPTAIRHRLFDTTPLTNVSHDVSSMEVNSLWEDAVSGSPAYKSFEFREKIVRLGLNAFGTDTVYEWIAAQLKNNIYTDYHSRWIDETLKFVLTGQKREFSYNVWYSLIVTGGSDKSKLLSDTVERFVGKYGFKPHCTWPEFIQAWASQPGGVDDLLQSLHVLFGKRG